MNEFDRLRRQAERMKETYPPGTRIELISMEDPFAPIPSGIRGTVKVVDDIGQLHMHWDNGRSLAVVPGEDSFRKLTSEEIEAENKTESQDETQAEDNGMTMRM
ncbi:MAG: DUF4314 domain-containing protein [Eubacterium sp.]|nr:DUF4314 domain-containing protein [Eubacterium sp.]